MAVETGKTRVVRSVRNREVVHPSNTGGPLPAHELAAAAIVGWRRWGPALEEWARASRGAREPDPVAVVQSRDRRPIDDRQSPPAASVGSG